VSRGRWLAAAAGVVALLLAGLFVVPRAQVAPAESTSRLAVLLPRVSLSADAPQLSALTVNAELIARLPERRGVEVVSAPYASSVRELREQLEAIGTSSADAPDWILDVNVVVTRDAAHVVALLYRGADLGIAGRDSFDQRFDGVSALAIEVPRAIAERVGAIVAEAMPE
jgi:hypothetical protein